jgi:hypothetical protein
MGRDEVGRRKKELELKGRASSSDVLSVYIAPSRGGGPVKAARLPWALRACVILWAQIARPCPGPISWYGCIHIASLLVQSN